jgi:hypothetical protein
MVVVVLLVAVSSQIVTPNTRIGFQIEKLVADSGGDWIIATAIWTPTAMLVGVAFELIEAVIVLSLFRQKMALQD